MSVIVGIDPGKTIGAAILVVQNKEILKEVKNQYAYEDGSFFQFLKQLSLMVEDNPTDFHVVVESFELRPEKASAQYWSQFETCEVIGAVKFWANLFGASFTKQRANIKPVAQKWSGVKVPSNHSISHQYDAYNHAYYYGVQQKLIRHRLLSVKHATEETQ